jgi:hypothetical protein
MAYKKVLEQRTANRYSVRMISTQKSPANQQKLAQLRAALAELLAQVLTRGFHGAATIEVVVHEGTIQTIRRRVEQVER